MSPFNLIKFYINTQIIGNISCLVVLLCLNACAVVPKHEFSDYQAVFKQVREVGERIIIDYAVAKKEQAQLEQAQFIQTPRKNYFDSEQLIFSTVSVDDVAIRLKAWEIVDVYNEMLAQLIAGKVINRKNESLWNKLVHLSVSTLRETAAKLSPSAAALNAIVSEIEKGFERHRVVDSIQKMSSVISSKLILQMKKDSELFYQVRYGLNSYYYQQIRVNISRHIAAFIYLAHEMKPSFQKIQVQPLIDTLNRRLQQIAPSATGKIFQPIHLTSSLGRRNDALALSQLAVLKNQILSLVFEAEKKNIELRAYSDMLTAYVGLLGQMDFYLRMMEQAAQTGRSNSRALGRDFNIALIKMRQAFLYYQKIN